MPLLEGKMNDLVMKFLILAGRKDEWILVIHGTTYLYFLKTFFGASPEFKLEDVAKYLKS